MHSASKKFRNWKKQLGLRQSRRIKQRSINRTKARQLALEPLEQRQMLTVDFLFNAAPGTPTNVIQGFEDAGQIWKGFINDDVTVVVDIAAEDLGGPLGTASNNYTLESYTDVRNALLADANSVDDVVSSGNLPAGAALDVYINLTDDNPDGSGSATPYVDSDGGANNMMIEVPRANARALGLIAADSPAADGSIKFDTINFDFDFDRSDGITPGETDFVFVATHEIGHLLGFTSGIGVLDNNDGQGGRPGPFNDDAFDNIRVLDLFRSSAASVAANANLDFTADTRTKNFSLDGGATVLGTFSTGVNNGDGFQASHWKNQVPPIGIMDPNAGNGEFGVMTGLDLVAFDVIGWDVSTLDRFEPNDTIGSATPLGSETEITLRDLTLGIDDEDFFEYTAHDTGKLIVSALFQHDAGDIDLEILDSNGNVIASSVTADDNETIKIPVVKQENYFIHVVGAPTFAVNNYSLEIENFAAPVPTAVVLDRTDDTGISNRDNITSEDEARVFVEADLAEFAANGIDILTNSEIDDDEPGAAVQVYVNGLAVGYAEPISGTGNTLFEYTFEPGELSTTSFPVGGGGGENFVKAAVRIFDGQQDGDGEPDPVDARTQLSPTLPLVLDQSIGVSTIPDMLAASDSGNFNNDNVTSIVAPAFTGTAEANSMVFVYANGLRVGEGEVGTNGIWEVTVEPLADGAHTIAVVVEDLAGNRSTDQEGSLDIWIDSQLPNTPYLDLVSDTGVFDDDNITSVNLLVVTMTASDTENGNGNPFPNDIILRVYDRPGTVATNGEVLIYDSWVEFGDFTTNGFLSRTLSQTLNNPAGTPLTDGVHNLKLVAEDRAGNISDFLLTMTIDSGGPGGDLNLIDLIDSSDSGMFDDDNVTSITAPAFSGIADANAMVRVFALQVGDDGLNFGQPLLIGEGVVGSDLSDIEVGGEPDDGRGLWEVTVEPLDDGVYDIYAEFEDLAGNTGRTVVADEGPQNLRIEIDAIEPNTAYLDLIDASDSGRFEDDNVTNDTTPTLTMTTHDENTLLHQVLFSDNLKFRIFDRFEETNEVLIYDSSVDATQDAISQPGDGFTSATFLTKTLGPLAEGTHNLKLEVEDRAGNISHDFLLSLTIDTTAVDIDNLDMLTASDSGNMDDDNVTKINAPAFSGTAEPNAIVTVFANGEQVGEDVVNPDGTWEVTVEPLSDGAYEITAQAEDLAGNISVTEEALDVWIDTQLPNVPYLDLVSDSGRFDEDDVTNVNKPVVTVTANDTEDGNGNPFWHDIKYRIYDRPGDAVSGGEVLIIDTWAALGNVFTTGGFFTNTLTQTLNDPTGPALVDGVHNLKLVVEDRAGNMSEFLLPILIDTVDPGMTIPDMLAYSDSGNLDDDNVTNIQAPAFFGTSEKNAEVVVFANGLPVGTGVVETGGEWEVTVEPLADGPFAITATAEDLAGNTTTSEQALDVWIDTQVPNTPYLDLTTDSGRHDADDVTNVNKPVVTVTASDTEDGNGNPFWHDLQYRIYDRPGDLVTDGELLMIDSWLALGNNFTTDGFFIETLTQTLNDPTGPALEDGVHNLKLVVEDRAGNLSDFLLMVTIDTVVPPVSIIGIDPAATDTGVIGQPDTFVDRITYDTATGFVGLAEANTVIRLFVDPLSNGAIGIPGEYATTVTVPFDGNHAFPDGQWTVPFIHDLNNPNFFPIDGVREVAVTAEDLAGNISDPEFHDIFIDTRGPRVEEINITDEELFNLFDHKTEPDGTLLPTPPIFSLDIDFIDEPERVGGIPSFVYPAVNEILATTPGNYALVGDENGIIPIDNIEYLDNTFAGTIGRTTVRLHFAEALPDDRFTLTVSDRIMDDAGNALDGETNASEPHENPFLPSGDGVPGEDFIARFTVDSRAELGVWAAGSVWLDLNGNLRFDNGSSGDYTNGDITHSLGFTTDHIFAGNFSDNPNDIADGFDKLAAYGRMVDGGGSEIFRWLIDTNNDGVSDLFVEDPSQIIGEPVAGNFDSNPFNGDEVGLFTGKQWFIDTDHDYKVDTAIPGGGPGDMVGLPVVGDFDGDGEEDGATWQDDMFMIDTTQDGFADFQFNFGFIGVRERPIAADFDADGFDDIGLWVPDRHGVNPEGAAEWYILISGGESILDRIEPDPNDPGNSTIFFTPEPFGKDLHALFGDQFALPVVGNFDPPVAAAQPDGPGNATEIVVDGPAAQDAIESNSDADWFEFTLYSTSEVAIETSGVSGDTQMWLYGPYDATSQVAYDDDGGEGQLSRIVLSEQNALPPGTYYVMVNAAGNNDVIDEYAVSVSTVASFDSADLNLLLSSMGTAGGASDINSDGIVNAEDLDILLLHFGAESDTPEPEPVYVPIGPVQQEISVVEETTMGPVFVPSSDLSGPRASVKTRNSIPSFTRRIDLNPFRQQARLHDQAFLAARQAEHRAFWWNETNHRKAKTHWSDEVDNLFQSEQPDGSFLEL